MAGEWIKMRHDLVDDPAVVLIASRTSIDEYGVVGRLQKLWSWADRHTVDGNAMSVTRSWIDRYVSCSGFADAMFEADWLEGDDGAIDIPKFEVHNGESAKKRALGNKRVALSRNKQREGNAGSNANGNADGNAPSVTKSVTREEKNKSSKQPPIPPMGGETEGTKKRPIVALKTFLEQCKEKSEKPILESDTVFDYATKTGIPDDFLRLHWLEFKARYCEEGAKRYKDWRSVFRKSVRGNWFKLWWIGADGSCALTTVGEQAKRAHGRDAA
jgi:hypothetical protein